MTITGTTLATAMGHNLPLARYTALADDVNKALKQANCTTVNRAAMFLAQIGHESMGLRYMEEIASGREYEGWSQTLGNTHTGDGVRFKGRGPLQVTGRRNYTNLSKWAHDRGYVPTASYFVDHPTRLASDQYAFLGAVWFWTTQANFNALSDRSDIRGVTRAINGPALNGYSDRIARYNRCKKLGSAILPAAVLTRVKTLKVGDVARVVRGPAPARKTPGGAHVLQNGKQLARSNGFQFTVTKLAKSRAGTIWARTNHGIWYCTTRLAAYRKV